MKNFLALSFVTLFLAACAGYTYQNTHHGRQSLIPEYPASAWDAYVRDGGAFRGI